MEIYVKRGDIFVGAVSFSLTPDTGGSAKFSATDSDGNQVAVYFTVDQLKELYDGLAPLVADYEHPEDDQEEGEDVVDERGDEVRWHNTDIVPETSDESKEADTEERSEREDEDVKPPLENPGYEEPKARRLSEF